MNLHHSSESKHPEGGYEPFNVLLIRSVMAFEEKFGPDPNVHVADREDLQKAVENALERAGCNFHQLAFQARRGEFESTRARLAWMAIGDLYGVDLSETDGEYEADLVEGLKEYSEGKSEDLSWLLDEEED